MITWPEWPTWSKCQPGQNDHFAVRIFPSQHDHCEEIFVTNPTISWLLPFISLCSLTHVYPFPDSSGFYFIFFTVYTFVNQQPSPTLLLPLPTLFSLAFFVHCLSSFTNWRVSWANVWEFKQLHIASTRSFIIWKNVFYYKKKYKNCIIILNLCITALRRNELNKTRRALVRQTVPHHRLGLLIDWF